MTTKQHQEKHSVVSDPDQVRAIRSKLAKNLAKWRFGLSVARSRLATDQFRPTIRALAVYLDQLTEIFRAAGVPVDALQVLEFFFEIFYKYGHEIPKRMESHAIWHLEKEVKEAVKYLKQHLR